MKSSATQSVLWSLACKGDQHAYASLHKKMYTGLYHYLFQMFKDPALADDLLQEVFVKLWQKRNQIGIIKNVNAYFFTAVRATAINHFRRVKSHNSKLKEFDQPEVDFSAEDIIISSEEGISLKIMIAQALNSLPARQREIIYLKYYEEMDYQKIAEVTGIQYQSVVNHVFRALQALRITFNQTMVERC